MFSFSVMSRFSTIPQKLYRTAIVWSIVSTTIPLLVFVYLGFFSRYTADDYCHANYFPRGSNIFRGMRQEYMSGSNRFMMAFLTGMSEFFGPSANAYLPIIFIVLWVGGLGWLLFQVDQLTGWQGNVWLSLLFAEQIAFFSILQAPNRYQVIYWRSGIATYFAPLVFLPIIAGYILRSIKAPGRSTISQWMRATACFGMAFLVGGFSETTVAMQTSLVSLAIMGVWFWAKGEVREASLCLLLSTLLGTLLAMGVIILSPANAIRQMVFRPPPTFPRLVWMSLDFARDFVVYSVRSLPLPTIVSFVIPVLIVFGISLRRFPNISPREQLRRLWPVYILIPLAAYLLIVSVCAPSVYGESAYPEARALFPARFIMTTAIIAEGALLGYTLGQFVQHWETRKSQALFLASLLLLLSTLYPLRAGLKVAAQIPDYQKWAAAWDQRDAQIRALKQTGVMDIEVVALDSWPGVKEVDSNPKHWVNRCAAIYYGVNTIRANQ